jgi:hypothetical protein
MTKLLDLPDVVGDGASDVLDEDQLVHVPQAAVELAHSLEHRHDPTFVADVPDWAEDA